MAMARGFLGVVAELEERDRGGHRRVVLLRRVLRGQEVLDHVGSARKGYRRIHVVRQQGGRACVPLASVVDVAVRGSSCIAEFHLARCASVDSAIRRMSAASSLEGRGIACATAGRRVGSGSDGASTVSGVTHRHWQAPKLGGSGLG